MEGNLEQKNVQEVYESIASHFSETRYKAWPVVDKFFKDLLPLSVGLDVGCGNGKNMRIREDVTCIGFDLCWNLLEFVQQRGLEAVYGNMLSLPFKNSSFDFVISIAAIHHLASEERRRAALAEMGRVVKPGGTILVFAWALEQPPTSSLYRHALKYLHQDNKQDVLVPWKNKVDGTEHHRYYHLFMQGELEALAVGTGLQVMQSGYDKDNWYTIYQRPHINAE